MCGSDHALAYWSMYSPMLRRDTSAADEAPRSERCNQSAFPPLQTDERALSRNHGNVQGGWGGGQRHDVRCAHDDGRRRFQKFNGRRLYAAPGSNYCYAAGSSGGFANRLKTHLVAALRSFSSQPYWARHPTSRRPSFDSKGHARCWRSSWSMYLPAPWSTSATMP